MTSFFFSSRPVGEGWRSKRGEPQVKVWEPGPRPVHWEPDVGLQRLPDHRHKGKTQVMSSKESGEAEAVNTETGLSLRQAQEFTNLSEFSKLTI